MCAKRATEARFPSANSDQFVSYGSKFHSACESRNNIFLSAHSSPRRDKYI